LSIEKIWSKSTAYFCKPRRHVKIREENETQKTLNKKFWEIPLARTPFSKGFLAAGHSGLVPFLPQRGLKDYRGIVQEDVIQADPGIFNPFVP